MSDTATEHEPVVTLDEYPRLTAVRIRMSVRNHGGNWEDEALYELRVCDDCGTAVIDEFQHRYFHNRTEPQPDF